MPRAGKNEMMPSFGAGRGAGGKRGVKITYCHGTVMEWCLGGYGLVCVHKCRWSGRIKSQATIPRKWLDFLWDGACERIAMDFFNRPGAASKGEPSPANVLVDEEAQRECPTLFQFLTATSWPDGTSRQVSSLVVFAEDKAWKVCLSDRDTGNNIWASSTTYSGLLGALEGRLTEPCPDWRKARPRNKKP